MSKSYQKILSQVPPDYYEYGLNHNSFQRIWHEAKWKNLRSILMGKEGKLLDVGCADGNLTRKIANKFKKIDVVGVDMYGAAIDFAKKKKSKAKFLHADARKIPFKKKYFDVVTCIETLEHIPGNHKVLDEIKRVLKNKGLLIVIQDTDNLAFKFIWVFWTMWKGKVWRGSHVNCMSPVELQKLLEKRGFIVEKKHHTHFGLEVTFQARKI